MYFSRVQKRALLSSRETGFAGLELVTLCEVLAIKILCCKYSDDEPKRLVILPNMMPKNTALVIPTIKKFIACLQCTWFFFFFNN